MKLRPKDWKTPKYWLHLGVIAVVVLGLLEVFVGGGMFTVKNILLSVPLIGAGDITAHTLLRME